MHVTFTIKGGKQYIFLSFNDDRICTPQLGLLSWLSLEVFERQCSFIYQILEMPPDFMHEVVLCII